MSYPTSITVHELGPRDALISLGANLPGPWGGPQQSLQQAITALSGIASTVLACSSVYRSVPINCPAESPDFLNQICLLEVAEAVDAPELLSLLQTVERELGRQASEEPNAPRILDLDLIAFGKLQCQSPDLQLPHPRWQQRRFVVEPLFELCPELVLPGQAVSLRVLLDTLLNQQVERV